MDNTEKNKILSLVEIKDTNILDVGCGDGRYCEFFINQCSKYVGIDIDKIQINRNNAKNSHKNASYEWANIINYQSETKFDIIVLSLSFHEIDIKEQGLALVNMLNLLKDNGKIIIIDPTIDEYSFQGLWNVAYNNLLYFNHDYVVKHSQEVLENSCKNNLCKLIKRDKISLKFKFDSIEEILDMILECEEFELLENSKVRDELRVKILDFLSDANNIILEDKLDITILEKVK